jgi:hypothetical protein
VHDWRPVRELSKRDRVLVLLEQWQAIHDPLTSPHGARVTGTGRRTCRPCRGTAASASSSGSYATSASVSRAFIGICGRSSGLRRRSEPRTRARRRPNGKRDTVTVREQVRLLPSWLDADLVRHGVSTVTLRFRGECVLPDELGECLPEYIRRADKA